MRCQARGCALGCRFAAFFLNKCLWQVTRAALRLGRSRDAENTREAREKLTPDTGKLADFCSPGDWQPRGDRVENWFGEPVHPEGNASTVRAECE